MRKICNVLLFFFFCLGPLSGLSQNQKKQLLVELLKVSRDYSDFSCFIEDIKEYGMLHYIPNICPINENKEQFYISSNFGYRIDPITKERKKHLGIDFVAKIATSIYSTADGIITFAGECGGYGKCVFIKHRYGFETRYAHLTFIYRKRGERIKKGSIIGLLGNTGKSTGEHLHYEIRKNNKPINPKNFLEWNKIQTSCQISDISLK